MTNDYSKHEAEIQQIIKEIKNGNEFALDKLVNHGGYMALAKSQVGWIYQKYKDNLRPDVEYDDLLQEAHIAINDIAMKYDVTRGMKATTFITQQLGFALGKKIDAILNNKLPTVDPSQSKDSEGDDFEQFLNGKQPGFDFWAILASSEEGSKIPKTMDEIFRDIMSGNYKYITDNEKKIFAYIYNLNKTQKELILPIKEIEIKFELKPEQAKQIYEHLNFKVEIIFSGRLFS